MYVDSMAQMLQSCKIFMRNNNFILHVVFSIIAFILFYFNFIFGKFLLFRLFIYLSTSYYYHILI